MKVEKIDSYKDYENKKRADKYMMIILNGADFFEYRMRTKPIVFVSNDVLAIIAYYHRDKITHQIHGEPLTVCGYDLKVTFGENVLCVGCSLSDQI